MITGFSRPFRRDSPFSCATACLSVFGVASAAGVSGIAGLVGVSILLSGCDEDPIRAPRPDISATPAPRNSTWTESDRALLDSLSLAELRPAPKSISNRVSNDPRAAELGHRLFFDAGLSANGRVACATCHQPALLFTDGQATSRGLATTTRNAPSLVGVAHATWLYWDGRRDSLWAQALAPLEAAAEMGSNRLAVVRRVTTQSATAGLYREIFGAAPNLDDAKRFSAGAGPFGDVNDRAAWTRMSSQDRLSIDHAFANVGKAIAAYERLLQPGPSRFDRYVESLRRAHDEESGTILDEDEIQGLRLFINGERTPCLQCHSGPLLTNQSFHDVGTASTSSGLPEFGRFLGIQAVLIDPFNCLGRYSDASPADCAELRFLNKSHLSEATGKFKTPTLRGLRHTAPYLHDGRFQSLDEVIDHYRNPETDGDASLEIQPLEISDDERRALVAFLDTLDGPIATSSRWLAPPHADPAHFQDGFPPADRAESKIGSSRPESTQEPTHAFSAKSAGGNLTVYAWPEDGEIPLRELHSWLVRIEDPNGAAVTPTRMTIDGGMSQHAHGFDTMPQLTQRLANGNLRIQGMKFHMTGNWQLKLEIVADDYVDVAIVEIDVQP